MPSFSKSYTTLATATVSLTLASFIRLRGFFQVSFISPDMTVLGTLARIDSVDDMAIAMQPLRKLDLNEPDAILVDANSDICSVHRRTSKH
jgi:hypothetical protein